MSPTLTTLGQKSIGTGELAIPKLFDVAGWVAVVTGGGTGLGLVTAAALAENGTRVYITGRRADKLEAAVKSVGKEGAIVPVQADCSTKEGIQKLRDFIQEKEKYINVFINNHGVSEGNPVMSEVEQTPEALSKHMFENETFERWGSTYSINAASYYFTSWAFLPLLTAAKSHGFPEPGNVVNIASMSGITQTSQRGQFNYNAAKAATRMISKMLATEWARLDFGVRVNTISPGYFPSGMTPADPTLDAEHYKGAQWAIPFGRPGNAVDYSQTIFGIICNAYMTGAEVVIDGGWLLTQAF
ncbi:hypothetical protein Q5752_001402 [Cryptotrichosporon argae]